MVSVTDKSTGLPLFSDLVWFAYKVSQGVMYSASVCEYCWSIRNLLPWDIEILIDEPVDE